MKKYICKFFFMIFIIASFLGWTTNISQKIGFYKIEKKGLEYLKESRKKNMELFISFSISKALLDVIEGSDVELGGIGVGVNVEAGDVVQPIYDLVNLGWYITLIGLMSLNLQILMLKVSDSSIFNFFLGIGLLLFFINIYIKKEKFKKIIKKIGIIMISIFIFFCLGIKLYIISQKIFAEKIETNYKKEKIQKMNKDFEEVSKAIQEIKNSEIKIIKPKETIETLKENFNNLNEKTKISMESLVEGITWIFLVYLINLIILPIIFLLIFKIVLRNMILFFINNPNNEIEYISLKEEI